jgi:hypothetical protein
MIKSSSCPNVPWNNTGSLIGSEWSSARTFAWSEPGCTVPGRADPVRAQLCSPVLKLAVKSSLTIRARSPALRTWTTLRCTQPLQDSCLVEASLRSGRCRTSGSHQGEEKWGEAVHVHWGRSPHLLDMKIHRPVPLWRKQQFTVLLSPDFLRRFDGQEIRDYYLKCI